MMKPDSGTRPRLAVIWLGYFLTGILRVLGTKAQVERVLWSADALYPLRGSEHPAYKRTRYIARCLVLKRPTDGWLELLFSQPPLLQLLKNKPELAEKIHRPYLRADFPPPRRLAALRSHYEICLHHRASQLLLASMSEGIEISRVEGKNGTAFRLTLEPPDDLLKEGEMALRWEMEGDTLYRLAFTLQGSPADMTVFIGCLQGTADEQGEDLIRAATRALYGLRPRDLMITAIQGLSLSLGAARIVGVNHQLHIYRHIHKRREVLQDYDLLWQEADAVQLEDGTYQLPMVKTLRPLSEYASKRRAEAARRQALIKQVLETIAQQVSAQRSA